ncbi:MAG TPA: YraN family protein [Gemmatimonadaceae bacterium]|nr:YraN family protein [Gemmatimonadaceae bacterium]
MDLEILSRFFAMSREHELGHFGERVAAKWLRLQGWNVLWQRFKNGHRDIDIIARKANTIAFVEVKTRSDLSFGDPITAVGYYKLEQLWRSASVWVIRHGPPGVEYRVDVICVLVRDKHVKIRHVENAHTFNRSR